MGMIISIAISIINVGAFSITIAQEDGKYMFITMLLNSISFYISGFIYERMGRPKGEKIVMVFLNYLTVLSAAIGIARSGVVIFSWYVLFSVVVIAPMGLIAMWRGWVNRTLFGTRKKANDI